MVSNITGSELVTRILATLLLLLSRGTFVSTTLAANAPDRPSGIDADHRVLLGESIGIVLTAGEESTPADNGYSGELPPLMPDRDALIAPTSQFVIDAQACGSTRAAP